MSEIRRFLGLVLFLAVFTAVLTAGFTVTVASAQPLDTVDVGAPFGLDEDEDLGELFGDRLYENVPTEDLINGAYDLIQQFRLVRARELTEEILRRDPRSPYGHLLLGLVHYLSDANLPLALYHAKESRQLFESRFGHPPLDPQVAPWYGLALFTLADVSGSMGRHRDKVRYILEYGELFEPQPAELGWPLMRMRRYDAARSAVREAIESGDPMQEKHALTALCAIEAEEQRREASWEACLAAAEHERGSGRIGPTPFTNAAEAALGMLRFDEAERLIQEGGRYFSTGAVSNPWLDLTHLYLTEGRLSEALDSLRRMFKWRRRQPAWVDVQNRAETEVASAVFLLAAGRGEEAARLSRRILERPDRTGFTSSESEQMEAAHALVDHLAQRLAAELLAERASTLPWRQAWRPWLESRRHRLSSWTSGRRTASFLADERVLLATLRPYLAGSMELPEWLELDLVALLGPGVVKAALGEAREVEELDGAAGYFTAYESEISFLKGDWRRSVALVEQAMQTLPQSEVLLRGRLAARAAESARRGGEGRRALEYYDQALQLDPGVLRRLGARLPVSFEATSGGMAARVVEILENSPRLDDAGSGWFRVRFEGDEKGGRACLVGPQGTLYNCATARARAGEDEDALARRLAREFHDEVFAPRLDLTQADLRSLDGSPTAGGGRASERLRSVLTDLVGEEGG